MCVFISNNLVNIYVYVFIDSPTEKRRRQSINKKENEIPLLEQSLISEIKKTDESMNKMISDPITAFCNYLATQLRTLSQHNFTTCQRRILSLLFELQDNYTQ